MKSLDGEGINRYDGGCDGEDLERIVITDREAVFDFITHLENPLKYISFRNLKELVEMELPHMFYERRHRTRRAEEREEPEREEERGRDRRDDIPYRSITG